MRVSLVPVPPTGGPSVPIDRSPFWVGSGANCSLRTSAAGVAERHFSLVERNGVVFLSPFPNTAAPRVDGRAVTGPVELTDGQIIELGSSAKWELVTGAPRAAAPAREPTPAPPAIPPVTSPSTG